MPTKYASFIKNLRLEKNLSQEEVAQKIEISRPSYIAIEQGKRELSLPEAERLANVFGITLDELMNISAPNYEKYRQMLIAFLKSDVSRDGKVPKTKLAKLLYLADFGWYYKHLVSMSGMRYRKIAFGPVPNAYFRVIDELFDEGKINIDPTEDGAMLISLTRSTKKQSLDTLNKEEKNLIQEIASRWKNKKTNDIVSFTHNQLPYKICRDNEIIPYELITQEDPEYVY